MSKERLQIIVISLTIMFTGLASASWEVTGVDTVFYRSEATNEDGKLVYREKHTVRFDEERVLHSLTEYFSPGGDLIATMDSDYAKSVSMPTYVFEDLVRGYREGLRLEGDTYVVFKQERGREEETRPLRKTDNVFSCQGWHYFLVNNLDLLEEGNIKLDLVLPSELKAHSFQVEQTGAEGDLIKAVIKIDNWFLRLFAPKLRLVYSKSMQRLVEYEGLSNIPAADGGRQDVRIVYSYDDIAPAVEDSSQVDQPAP
jgi:hypothetical protein